jgi:hypothetical protein
LSGSATISSQAAATPGVGQRQIALGHQRLAGVDGDFARGGEFVVIQCCLTIGGVHVALCEWAGGVWLCRARLAARGADVCSVAILVSKHKLFILNYYQAISFTLWKLAE